jgi:uncharacterized repeat protein (TIGR03803 family)
MNIRSKSLLKLACTGAIAALSCAVGTPAMAGTYTVLHQFTDGIDGGNPESGVVLDAAGNIYGTTAFGGDPTGNGIDGVIFKSDPLGNVTTLHAFNGLDGAEPTQETMTLLNTTLYGGTTYGGPSQDGVIFSVQTDGSAYTILHAFSGADGIYPTGMLQYSPGRGLIGVTSAGGANVSVSRGQGVLFAIEKTGVFKLLHKFQTQTGSSPNGVLLGSNGLVFGAAAEGGTGCTQKRGCGLIYSFDLKTGVYTILYQFTYGSDGTAPILGSIATDGTIYGATKATKLADGTLFSMTTSGGVYQLKTLATFGKNQGQPTDGPHLTATGSLVGAVSSPLGTGQAALYGYKDGRLSLLQKLDTAATGLLPYGQLASRYGTGIVGTTYNGGITPCVAPNGQTVSPQGCGVLYRYTPQ